MEIQWNVQNYTKLMFSIRPHPKEFGPNSPEIAWKAQNVPKNLMFVGFQPMGKGIGPHH